MPAASALADDFLARLGNSSADKSAEVAEIDSDGGAGSEPLSKRAAKKQRKAEVEAAAEIAAAPISSGKGAHLIHDRPG